MWIASTNIIIPLGEMLKVLCWAFKLLHQNLNKVVGRLEALQLNDTCCVGLITLESTCLMFLTAMAPKGQPTRGTDVIKQTTYGVCRFSWAY